MLKIIGGFLFWSALVYFAFLLGSKAEAAVFGHVGTVMGQVTISYGISIC